MKENVIQLRHSRLTPLLVLAVALAILGAAIFADTARMRRSVGGQLVSRDGEILQAVALARQFSNGAETNLAGRLQDPANQLALVLNISQIMEGVLAVRLFDADGKFVTAFPPDVTSTRLDAGTIAELKRLQPVSLYRRDGSLAGIFFAGTVGGAATNPTPLMVVNIPIHTRGQRQLIAAAQIILDAQNLERELAALDRNLWWRAWLAFLSGGGLLTAAFLWAWRRLQASHTLLLERTTRLLRANHELALALKTGALGAVTAHLVHGLSNPLAHLQHIVAAHRGNGQPDGEWQEVEVSTRRMRQIVEDVVRVLGEASSGDNYEITLAELAGILSEKLQAPAQAAGVHWEVKSHAPGRLANRHANLVLLILENLARNALQVTPRGRRVEAVLAAANGGVTCRVVDEGPGFPPQLRDRLFMPCRSTKGGNGIGLAISQQLAAQMGAPLELAKSDSSGCVFQLTIPAAILAVTKAAA